jgi:hypothetical protein
MRRRRLSPSAEFLQWFGLGGAALAWAAQLVIGFGATVARCGAGGARLGIDLDTWELTTFAVALAFVVAAEAAAAVTVARTWGAAYDGPPPDGRRRFFALGALVGNLLFAVVILLSGIAVVTFDPCRQA